MNPSEEKEKRMPSHRNFQFYVSAGILTVVPIAVTVWVVHWIFAFLSQVGAPLLKAGMEVLEHFFPAFSSWEMPLWMQSSLAFFVALAGLYFLGRLATHVLGARCIAFFDRLVGKIPFAKMVYGNTKKLLSVLQPHTGEKGHGRVVLIDFPREGMKAIGFLTARLEEEKTGRKLAAVFVPTTPNPSSGYLEILPEEKVLLTSWSIEEAMQYIVSGGVSFPNKLSLEKKDLSETKEEHYE